MKQQNNITIDIAVLLFEDFELLDVYGPLEMFGLLPEVFSIHLVAENAEYVKSAQGPRSVIDHTTDSSTAYDMILIPGGPGTRTQVDNQTLINWIKNQSRQAKFIAGVCTGSALLATSGVLNGKKATTNKRAFNWVSSQGKKVNWIAQARWVQDGRFFTSSGVSAGIDMSLGLIEHILGKAVSRQVALWAEYDWHDNPEWDPFAELNGLV